MIAFKYRGGDDIIFERDLNSIENNFFWAPHHLDLNDPCETLVHADGIKSQMSQLNKLFGVSGDALATFNKALEGVMSRRSKIGIYSLSKSSTHELLWAHYANSHKGFCIEYDSDILIDNNSYQDFHFFPVGYADMPPNINIQDVSNSDRIDLVKKLAGTKSKLWSYEEELRIVTDIIGENYYDYSAVTSIYFGYRMNEAHKKEIMKRLKGRGINYFQIFLEDKSYTFTPKPIDNLYNGGAPYLFEIPKVREVVRYDITEKSYDRFSEKGIITIVLDQKINESEIEFNAIDLKNKLFRKAKHVFISYMLEGMVDGHGYWATATFEEDSLQVSIYGLTSEQEKFLVEGLRSEQRSSIGMWIDDSPFNKRSLALFNENEKIILEIRYVDGSKSEKQLRASAIENGTRYDDYEVNEYGEYFTVDNSGVMRYFSPEGMYRKLKPLEKD